MCEVLRTMRALMPGRFEDSERMAQQAFDRGSRCLARKPSPTRLCRQTFPWTTSERLRFDDAPSQVAEIGLWTGALEDLSYRTVVSQPNRVLATPEFKLGRSCGHRSRRR